MDEDLRQRRDSLQNLQEMMAAKLNAHPHDYGVRVWWGFIIIGVVVGWMGAPDIQTILLFGLAFWIAGLFFCIFVIDSAEVQSKTAIFLNRMGMKRIAHWLYQRALTVR